jgi:penicillin-binding protein 2
MVEALRRSCNIYFYRTGMRIGLKCLTPYARVLGFGRRLGVDTFGERAGIFPDPQTHSGWTQGNACLLAIGQGRMAVTPLQAACLMAAVANGGHPVTPHVWLHASRTPRPGRVFSRAALSVVRQGLEEVVRRGTAYSAFHKGVDPLPIDVAGKTGTADVGSRDPDVLPHAWFAGYVPANDPRIAFCVFVQNGGHGGDVAAPIAYRVLRRIYGTRADPLGCAGRSSVDAVPVPR